MKGHLVALARQGLTTIHKMTAIVTTSNNRPPTTRRVTWDQGNT